MRTSLATRRLSKEVEDTVKKTVTLKELPEMLNVPAVAEFLGISTASTWRLVWSGTIPSVRLSERIVRIRKEDLVAWLDGKKDGKKELAGVRA
jgi:excisionase family DNA binding protein